MAIITGSWREPTNTSADEKGGIHDDATAQNLGFAGGTVAGSLHMEQFPPLLLQHFGDSWWQHGGLSLYFMNATMDKQPVRCFLDTDEALDNSTGTRQVKLWMENEAGERVMQGTGSLGDDPNSELRRRLEKLYPATDLRVLADVKLNQPCAKMDAIAHDAAIDERLAVITEDLPEYHASPNGQRVLPMAALVHIFRGMEPKVVPLRGPYVGLFGAIEVQYLNGPVYSDVAYHLQGEAIGLSESPKTEVVWCESTLTDPNDGRPVARMIKMDRLMKDASPLWTQAT